MDAPVGVAVKVGEPGAFSDFLSRSDWEAIETTLQLSCRESQILLCILRDDPEAVIATRLEISSHTVHSHLERLYRKLSVNSRCQAAVRVFREYVKMYGNGQS